MAKGCLTLIVLFALALFVEQALLVERSQPFPWLAAALLAASLTLALGSVQGVARALARRSEPETGPTEWREGRIVRTGGRIEPAGSLLRTPLGGREAVVVEYSIYRVPSRAQIGGSLQARPTPPHAHGLEMVPFRVRGAAGAIGIDGCPSLGQVPEADCDHEAGREGAARVLASETWRVSTVDEAASAAQALLGGRETALPLRLVNAAAVRELLAPEGEPNAGRWSGGPPPDLEGDAAVTAVRTRLAKQRWQLKERSLGPGDEVTVEGIYRADPPRIEVGRGPSLRAPERGIRPGLPAVTGRREARTAIAFALALASVAAVAHWFVYSSDGALYRSLVDWLVRAA
ncbi:MAG TPA: hypothetical protein VK855_11945 [Thioalkalivibrio sp.]|nr:hypothetical protein [Thioalkalivibrio sp.]